MSKKIKVAVIILAVLLVASVLALTGTLLYNAFHSPEPATSVVPDNLVSPEAGPDDTTAPATAEETSAEAETSAPKTETPEETTAETPEDETKAPETAAEPTRRPGANTSAPSDREPVYATTIYLHSRNTDDNEPFQATNMFPGDTETKYYCIRVSHEKDTTVHFRADVREGYEKLAEVLQCRVVLLTTGEVLYEGLMRDMPEAIDHLVEATGETTDELYYEIDAYLETSVGNEYQSKQLVADFRWWVEVDEVVPPTDTGDAPLWPYVVAASASLVLLILLTAKKKKEDAEHA